MSPSRVPLGDIADFVNGVAFKPDDWEESGKRILRIQNLTDSTKPFNRTNRAVAKKYEVSPGDLLVSWSATLGVFVWEGPDTALVNQHIFRVVPDHGRIDPCYLRHMLSDALVQMEQHLHGATMKHVNRGEFLATTIPLPPLDEQKRIAGILDAADALRAKRREALAELDTLLQSTFLDMFGDPVTNPMGWDTYALVEVGEVITGNTPSRKRLEYYGEDIEWIKSDNINDPSFVLTEAVERLSVTGKAVARTIPRGSILVTCIAGSPSCIGERGNRGPRSRLQSADQCLRAWRGHCALVRLRGVLGGQTTRSKCIDELHEGMVSKSAFSAISIPIPPTSLQSRFAAIVESVEQQKARQRAHLAELDTLFASLQSRAFRGDL